MGGGSGYSIKLYLDAIQWSLKNTKMKTYKHTETHITQLNVDSADNVAEKYVAAINKANNRQTSK